MPPRLPACPATFLFEETALWKATTARAVFPAQNIHSLKFVSLFFLSISWKEILLTRLLVLFFPAGETVLFHFKLCAKTEELVLPFQMIVWAETKLNNSKKKSNHCVTLEVANCLLHIHLGKQNKQVIKRSIA